MGWSNEETPKKGMGTSSKILLAIIACIIMIIILISILMLNIQQTTYTLTVDGQATTIEKGTLLTQIENVTYINIEEFAKLVDYEYHKGEYKEETATFYLNDNKVCKLPVNELSEDYREFTIENTIKTENGSMYAPVDAINLAFNVVVSETSNSLNIYTLDYLVTIYNNRVKEWGYTGISDQNFENQKALLYGYLIVKKENGLYKIIDDKNQKEIVSDRYTQIQFTENTKEFFVTNSLGQVGIINLNGTIKIEPIYNSISSLDKKSDLYLVEKDKKYGVVKSGNITIIYPEYDKIGIDTQNTTATIENQYLILDTLIPVCQNNQWGAFNKEGKLILKVEYDALGSNIPTVEINGIKKTVTPVLSIERCNGVVVKKDNKFGLIDITGKELVPIVVDNIYKVDNLESENTNYFMLYNNTELNIIERLIVAGLLEDNNSQEEQSENNNTTVNNEMSNTIGNTVAGNTINNTVINNPSSISENTVTTETPQNEINIAV